MPAFESLEFLALPHVRWPITISYLAIVALIAMYGLHRYRLVYLFLKHRRDRLRPLRRYDELPRVTVQVPLFNESEVARRIIDAACQLDYPRDRLQVQILDDSTDCCADIARERAGHWRDRGIDIQYRHRIDRTGYKAGALADATPEATGEFLALFDADFVPPRHFLHRAIHHFTDPAVGMVQARWTHLNREDSMLTRMQAIFLDGHFLIEHTARHRAGHWINFNGTAGIWRRQAIDDAGGWQHDTLTEDVDLSYRSQLAGWRCVFLPTLRCPAELPPEINAFKSQQHRWTKGSIQCAVKLLPRIARSEAPWATKVEAFFHLTSPAVYLLVTLLGLLVFPAFFANLQPVRDGQWAGLLLGATLFGLGTASAGVFYVVSQRVQRRSLLGAVACIPALMAVGIGIAISNARAVLEAIVGHQSAFVRTPKYNRPATAIDKPASLARFIPVPSAAIGSTALELAMAGYMVACLALALTHRNSIMSLPFLLLFAAGYLYVGLWSLRTHWRGRAASRSPAPVTI